MHAAHFEPPKPNVDVVGFHQYVPMQALPYCLCVFFICENFNLKLRDSVRCSLCDRPPEHIKI